MTGSNTCNQYRDSWFLLAALLSEAVSAEKSEYVETTKGSHQGRAEGVL